MTYSALWKTVGVITAFVAIVVAGMVNSSRHVRAHGDDDDDDQRDEARIQRGFDIAPVHLNLDEKNRNLVGLGSYLVNAVGDCNGCHSAGPKTEFLPSGNPFAGKVPTVVNPETYLGGGRDFGQFIPNSPFTLHIVSRNLTPDKTGRPEGGRTFEEFEKIMRHGVDLDHAHPNCMPGQFANCVPAPFDGELLQIMPWPVYQNMKKHDLRAIYEYLSAIPCIEGPEDPSNILHNDCH
jgi:hypothetical protein